MLDLDIPFMIVLFPNFLTQYEHVYEAFEALGMSLDHAVGQDVWNTLVNMEKVHFRPKAPKQCGEAGATKLVQGNLSARLPLLPFRIRPVIALSLLVALVCAPIGWTTLGASAVSTDQEPRVGRNAVHRWANTSLFLAPHRVRRWAGTAPFNATFLKGLSVYSLQRFPFETLYPGRAAHHHAARASGHPMG